MGEWLRYNNTNNAVQPTSTITSTIAAKITVLLYYLTSADLYLSTKIYKKNRARQKSWLGFIECYEFVSSVSFVFDVWIAFHILAEWLTQ